MVNGRLNPGVSLIGSHTMLITNTNLWLNLVHKVLTSFMILYEKDELEGLEAVLVAFCI